MTLQMRLVSARLPSGEHTSGPPTYHTMPRGGRYIGAETALPVEEVWS